MKRKTTIAIISLFLLALAIVGIRGVKVIHADDQSAVCTIYLLDSFAAWEPIYDPALGYPHVIGEQKYDHLVITASAHCDAIPAGDSCRLDYLVQFTEGWTVVASLPANGQQYFGESMDAVRRNPDQVVS